MHWEMKLLLRKNNF